MQEIGRELIFAFLQFLLRDARLLEDRNIESKLLALQHMSVKEIDNFARVLPGPCAQDPGTINCISTHVVVEERVEVQIGHATHLALKSAHLQFRLVVHLPDELLPILHLHLELLLLLSVKIGPLLQTERAHGQKHELNLHP